MTKISGNGVSNCHRFERLLDEVLGHDKKAVTRLRSIICTVIKGGTQEVVFQGPSGSGKTTLHEVIAAVIAKHGTETSCLHYVERSEPEWDQVKAYWVFQFNVPGEAYAPNPLEGLLEEVDDIKAWAVHRGVRTDKDPNWGGRRKPLPRG
jgi:energy-coupling factor transporter ATP-binding protein EcfA2